MTTDLLTRDAVADRKGGVWDYVSASRLNLWLRCPLAFKCKYIDGVRTPTSPAAFLGKVVHAGLEAVYRHRKLQVPLSLTEINHRVDSSWDLLRGTEDVLFESIEKETAVKAQATALVLSYVAQVPDDEPAPEAVEVALETALVDPGTGEDLGIPLVGIVDLIRDGPLITDFKTTSRSGAPLEVAHEIQLGCYSYLFRQVTGRTEAGLEIINLVKTKTPKVERHSFPARDKRHFQRLFAVIRAYLDALDSGKFVYRPGIGCQMCDFKNSAHCCGWNG